MSKLRKAEALHRKADMGLWVPEPMAGWNGWDADHFLFPCLLETGS